MEERRRTGRFKGELNFIRSDGTKFPGELSSNVFKDNNGNLRTSMIIRDVTWQKQTEEKIFRLNRLYSVLSKINEAIVRIHAPERLYEQVCKIAVEEGLFRMVWVGMVNPNTLFVESVASYGFEEGYLDRVRISINPEIPEGRGPTGTAIREGRYNICNDFEHDPRMGPWRDEGIKRGYRSSGAFPLKVGTHIIGTINFYKGEPYFFEEEEIEVRLLSSLADDLAFALESREEEKRRKRAEEKLQKSEGFLNRIIDESPYAMWISDDKGTLIRLNQACRDLLNITEEEVIGKYNVLKDNIVEEQGLLPLVKTVFEKGKTVRFEVKYDSSQLKSIELKGTAVVIIDVTIFPIKDTHGRVINAVIQHVDITGHRQAENEIKKSREQLRSLSAHLQSLREEERTLIAREIHDELGQALTGLKMDLSWVERKMSQDQKPLIEKIDSMSKLIDTTIQTVRKISTELRPGVLDDLGLIAAIEWQAQDFQNRTGIKCEFKSSLEEIELDRDRSTAAFRIFQETLTNVARHANATQVNIALREEGNSLSLQIEDNGRGIRKDEIYSIKSLGILGMRERVHIFNGEVKIEGKPGKGTTVTVKIPLKTT